MLGQSVLGTDSMCLQEWVVPELCDQILFPPDGWEGVLLLINAMILIPQSPPFTFGVNFYYNDGIISFGGSLFGPFFLHLGLAWF